MPPKLLTAILALLTAGAHAQNLSPTPPPARIGLDRHLRLAPGEIAFRGAIRSLTGAESRGYGDLALDYGLRSGLELGLRGTVGASRFVTLGNGGTLRNGGTDVEILARYARPFAFGTRTLRFGGQVGVAFPSTPAQNQPIFTLGALAETEVLPGFDLFLNPRAVFLDQNSITGFGIGFNAQFPGGFEFIGEVTPIMSGRNTRSAYDGSPRRATPFSVGIRYRLPSGFAIDAAFTNTLGATTGFGMTPGLGGETTGFLIGVTGKFRLGGSR